MRTTPRPILAPLRAVMCRSGVAIETLPAFVRHSRAAFCVIAPGACYGRLYEIGDVLACAETRDEAVGVLVPRGVGRPMIGLVRAGRLFGDGGEPCAAERWEFAGTVGRSVRGPPWFVAACAAFASARPSAPSRTSVDPRDQLALFAARTVVTRAA